MSQGQIAGTLRVGYLDVPFVERTLGPMTIADVDHTVVDGDSAEDDYTESSDHATFNALRAEFSQAEAVSPKPVAEDNRPTSEATFSVTQAAEACLVSRKTIVRRIPQLEEFGAWKDTQGQWVIPLSALLAADLKPGRPSKPEVEPEKPQPAPKAAVITAPATAVPGVDPAMGALRAEIADWQRRANDAERRAAVAEAIATERAGRVDDLRLALRQLEPVRTVSVVDEKKSGWRRFF